ncbi:MAG: hypothetical protein ACI8R9_000310 [Paraglaciecola sp.]|jgi:hypothetical protein
MTGKLDFILSTLHPIKSQSIASQPLAAFASGKKLISEVIKSGFCNNSKATSSTINLFPGLQGSQWLSRFWHSFHTLVKGGVFAIGIEKGRSP